MLKLGIQGLEDGESPFELEMPACKIPDISPVFQGTVRVAGTVRKTGRRHVIEAVVTAEANLICDISLEEYAEQIEAPVRIIAVPESSGVKTENDSLILLREDATYIDLTEEVQQEIAVHIPMKKISPKYRETTFGELHPELTAGEQSPADERWAALQAISFDSHT